MASTPICCDEPLWSTTQCLLWTQACKLWDKQILHPRVALPGIFSQWLRSLLTLVPEMWHSKFGKKKKEEEEKSAKSGKSPSVSLSLSLEADSKTLSQEALCLLNQEECITQTPTSYGSHLHGFIFVEVWVMASTITLSSTLSSDGLFCQFITALHSTLNLEIIPEILVWVVFNLKQWLIC